MLFDNRSGFIGFLYTAISILFYNYGRKCRYPAAGFSPRQNVGFPAGRTGLQSVAPLQQQVLGSQQNVLHWQEHCMVPCNRMNRVCSRKCLLLGGSAGCQQDVGFPAGMLVISRKWIHWRQCWSSARTLVRWNGMSVQGSRQQRWLSAGNAVPQQVGELFYISHYCNANSLK